MDTGFWIFGKKRMIPAGVIVRVDDQDRKVRGDVEGKHHVGPRLSPIKTVMSATRVTRTTSRSVAGELARTTASSLSRGATVDGEVPNSSTLVDAGVVTLALEDNIGMVHVVHGCARREGDAVLFLCSVMASLEAEAAPVEHETRFGG